MSHRTCAHLDLYTRSRSSVGVCCSLHSLSRPFFGFFIQSLSPFPSIQFILASIECAVLSWSSSQSGTARRLGTVQFSGFFTVRLSFPSVLLVSSQRQLLHFLSSVLLSFPRLLLSLRLVAVSTVLCVTSHYHCSFWLFLLSLVNF